jgi:cytoskeletal protein CcmA (bactofilin family)
MALWKETTMNQQSEEPGQDPAPAPVSPIPQRTESQKPERALNNNRESVFGAGVAIEGKIEGDSNLRIAGQFKGDINIKGDLNIEKGARISAKISAASVTIGGELEGNVNASAQVKLLESGQLIGDLKATTLTVLAGSRMRGHVEFGWSELESAKVASIRSLEKGKSGSTV